ncbi:MAG: DUF2326 domain-containing protein [Microgenomates group bacterium]
MYLEELSANKDTFHTVRFQPGLNLIVGIKHDQKSKDLNKTYNGVGKSLIVRLVHYCLGSEPIPGIKEKLPDWTFTLKFKIKDEHYTVTRSVENNDKVLLNENYITISELKDKLGREIFGLDNKIPFLSYRELLCRFIRPRKSSYVKYDTFVYEEKAYQKLINNGYLLGLDIGLILNKYQLKTKLDKVEESKKNIESDEIFKKYFGNDKDDNKDVEVKIVALEEEIKRLNIEKNEFKIAENYHEIRKDADDLDYKLRQIDNFSTVVINAVKQINESVKAIPDIPKERVYELYKEAKVELKDEIVKKIDDVMIFHVNLITNRKIRLLEQKMKLEAELKQLLEKRGVYAKKLNSNLEFLDTHGALEEYAAVTNKLTELRIQYEKLTSYKNLIKEYKNKVEDLKSLQFGQSNIDTNNYLKDAEDIIDKNIQIFRMLSSQFYKDKAGGIVINNNDGINQLRFNIKVSIDDDTSDGINEVKIFCYDSTLLLAKHNHGMKFIFHDSRLFSDMDPRQRATLFKIALKYTHEENLQYIASINEDVLTSFENLISKEEYEQIIIKSKILELTDESDSSRLLGIKVDLKYDEDD